MAVNSLPVDGEVDPQTIVHLPDVVGGRWRTVDANDGGWHFQAQDWQDRHLVERFGH